ncbi:MAG: hypothetical protein JWO48_1347 [Bryobacterales bacterium]|nr:hypothetical protein [Bryobacterales bacterium]
MPPTAGQDEVRPQLDETEQQEAEERSPISAKVVHEAIRLSGLEELERPPNALAWSGLAAGLSAGFSLVGEGLLRSHLPDQPWRPLICKLGYPLGFLIVILGKQQLFTENTLTPIIPLMTRRDRETLVKVLRLWAVVLISNLVGALAFAWVLGHTPVFSPEVQKAFSEIGQEAISVGFEAALLRGIFAGWLIALVVWILSAVESGHATIIIILTYIIGLGGFTHIVAGSVEAFFLVTTGAASWTECLGNYMLPTLIGNILGGVSLVSALNHAQVVAGRNTKVTPSRSPEPVRR